MAFTCSRLTDNEKETILTDRSHDNTQGIWRFWREIAVESGNTEGIWGVGRKKQWDMGSNPTVPDPMAVNQ